MEIEKNEYNRLELSMQLVYHKTSFKIVPMFIIDDKVEYITNYLWHTSEELKCYPCDFVTLRKFDSCSLDPGGMYCMKIPHKEFEVEGFNFDVQLSRIEEVIECMDVGDTNIPGYIIFPNFRWMIVMPKLVFHKVREKLKEIEMSDEALNSELMEKEIRENLIKGNPGFLDFPPKKGV